MKKCTITASSLNVKYIGYVEKLYSTFKIDALFQDVSFLGIDWTIALFKGIFFVSSTSLKPFFVMSATFAKARHSNLAI